MVKTVFLEYVHENIKYMNNIYIYIRTYIHNLGYVVGQLLN